MQPRFGIRSKLLLSILAILLVSYSLLLYSTQKTLNSSLRTEIDRDLDANLKFARSQFFDGAEIVKFSLKQVALSNALRRQMLQRDGAKLTERLRRWHAVLPSLEFLAVLDADKRVLARLDGAGAGTPLELQVADQALAGKRVMLSTELLPSQLLCACGAQGYCGERQGKEDALVIMVVMPVFDQEGGVLGCIVAGDVLNRRPGLPAKLKEVVGSDVEVTISQRGQMIASSSAGSLADASLLPRKVLDSLERGEVYRGEAKVGGRGFETAIDPIFNGRGEFVGALSVAVSTERFRKIRRENWDNLLASALVGVLCSFALAFVASRQLTGPLRQLAAGARKIEQGDLYQRVEDGHSDEVGALAASFNKMARALEERDSVITRKTLDLEELNGQLEQMVEQRTRDLSMEMGRLEAVLTSMAEGVVVTDRDNRVVLFNPAAQRMFELVPHRVIDQPIERICELGGFEALSARIGELTASGGSAAGKEALDLKGKRLQVNLAALAEESGSFAGIVLSIRDVTAEEQVDRMKTEFISTVSHELKTPLTSMKGSLQLLLNRGKWLTDTERQLLTVCYRNTQRLIRLITEILDISRIESGGMAFKFKPTCIGEITVYAVEEINSYAIGRGITIINSIPQQLPQVYGDSDRLIQVMTNLLSNAIKFSPEGKVVMVNAKQEGNYLVVSVSDRGNVIQWSDRDKLCKKFQQLQGSDGQSGSGLGLAICKEIVERHHGQIFYTAAKEPGNTFCFTVPVIGEGDGKG